MNQSGLTGGIAVRLNNISKMYRIYDNPRNKLKEALIRGIFRSQRSYHREFWALRDINLEISKGISLGFVGQNGSGKSTLLQIIAGILQQSSGTVNVQGRISALLELGAGFNREFTGRENVYINGAILGISREEIERRFEGIAEFADIGDFIDQPVKTYSSGMYVRLAFAIAVNVDPDILILDEALAVGDALFVNRCYQKMEEYRQKGKTIILVSHDTQAIRTFCDRAILLDCGTVLMEGDPKDVTNEYARLISSREEACALRKRDQGVSKDVEKIGSETDSEYRYGTGEAEIVAFNILDKNGELTNILEHGEIYIIRSTAIFHRPVKDPIMGMIIKTLAGFEMTVSSTHAAKMPIGPVDAEMKVTTEFELKMTLNPDRYLLSVGVSENTDSHIRPLDRRWDAMAFKVIGHSDSYGQVNMGTKIRIVAKKMEDIPV